jgi:hypothetical protein
MLKHTSLIRQARTGLIGHRLLVPKTPLLTPMSEPLEPVHKAPRAVPWTMIVLAGVVGAI